MSDQTMSAYKIVKTIVVCFAGLIVVSHLKLFDT